MGKTGDREQEGTTMPVPSVTSVTRRRRRTTYRRPRLRLVELAPRPAAHRARHTKTQLEAIRRRRARVLTAQAWVTGNVRYIVAALGAVAAFTATVTFLIGLADDRVRTILAVGAVIGFLAASLHHIANYTTDEVSE